MIIHVRSFFFTSALLASAACGGKSVAPQSTTSAGGASDAPPPADMAFKDMNADQRMAFMKLSVMPAMKAAFQEFDAQEFAEFTCKTCHGEGAVDGSFEMPNPNLPRLPKPENFAEYAKEPKHGKAIEFMAMKIKPEMAKLLKMSEFDPKTNTGDFGCQGCHLSEGQEAAPAAHEHEH